MSSLNSLGMTVPPLLTGDQYNDNEKFPVESSGNRRDWKLKAAIITTIVVSILLSNGSKDQVVHASEPGHLTGLSGLRWVNEGNDPSDVLGYRNWARTNGMSPYEIERGEQALEFASWETDTNVPGHPGFSIGAKGTFYGNDAYVIQEFDSSDSSFSIELTQLLKRSVFSGPQLSMDETLRLNELLAQNNINTIFVPYGITMADLVNFISNNQDKTSSALLNAKIRDSEVRSRGNATERQIIPLHPGFAVGTRGTFYGENAMVVQNFDGSDGFFSNPELNDLLRQAMFGSQALSKCDVDYLNLLLRQTGFDLRFVPWGSPFESVESPAVLCPKP